MKPKHLDCLMVSGCSIAVVYVFGKSLKYLLTEHRNDSAVTN